MKKRKIFLIIAFPILCATLIFLVVYLNQSFISSKLKAVVVEQLSKNIGRPVSLKSVKLDLIQGLVMQDLTVYEKDGKTEFAKIEKLTTTMLFIPLIREKKLIIPNIYVYSPTINIYKDTDYIWNFQKPMLFLKETGAQREQKKQKEKPRSFQVLVSKVNIEDGTLLFKDKAKAPAFEIQLTAINGEASISAKGRVNFDLDSYVDGQKNVKLNAKGSYGLGDKTLNANVKLDNLPAAKPYEYFYKKVQPVAVKDGSIDLLSDITIDPDRRMKIKIDSSFKNMGLGAFIVSLSGYFDLNGEINVDLSKPENTDYMLSVELKGPSLTGVPSIDEVTNITGVVEITKEKIATRDLRANLKGTDVKFTGGVASLSNPLLDISAFATLDLPGYRKFLPKDLQEKYKSVELSGKANIGVNFVKVLKDLLPGTLEGHIKFMDASVKTPVLPDPEIIERINGNISFTKDAIYASKLSFDFAGDHYEADAKIEDYYNAPDVRVLLQGKDLALNSRFQLRNKYLHLQRADLAYLNSSVSVTGDIIDLHDPSLDLRATSELNLIDIRKAFPDKTALLEKLNAMGKCSLDITANGPINDIKSLKLKARATSDKIMLKEFKIQNVAMDAGLNQGILQIAGLRANPYDGNLSIDSKMDLTKESPSYTLNLSLQDLDLGKLAADTKFRDKQVSGKADLTFDITGFAKAPETMSGEGTLFIEGARLWSFPLLGGFANLFNAPNLSRVEFKEGTGHFRIANKNLLVDSLVLRAPELNLMSRGSVGFNGNLDITATSSVSKDFVKNESGFGKIASILLNEAGQFIGEIRITGTLSAPKHKFVPVPIEKVLQDKLKGLFGGLF